MRSDFIPLERVVRILEKGHISASRMAAELNTTEPRAAELINRAMLAMSSGMYAKKKEDAK